MAAGESGQLTESETGGRADPHQCAEPWMNGSGDALHVVPVEFGALGQSFDRGAFDVDGIPLRSPSSTAVSIMVRNSR